MVLRRHNRQLVGQHSKHILLVELKRRATTLALGVQLVKLQSKPRVCVGLRCPAMSMNT